LSQLGTARNIGCQPDTNPCLLSEVEWEQTRIQKKIGGRAMRDRSPSFRNHSPLFAAQVNAMTKDRLGTKEAGFAVDIRVARRVREHLCYRLDLALILGKVCLYISIELSSELGRFEHQLP